MNSRWLLCGLAILPCWWGCQEKSLPFDPDSALEDRVSGEKAFQHVEALVGFGPRPAGSEALEESRAYLEEQLAALGWETRRQTFTAKTPEGQVDFVNLRARFGDVDWSKPTEGLLASHYDSKFYETFEFVGANDGGSSTGLLVELARVMRNRPEVAQRVELVFFDGEEAFGPKVTPTDGLYGSKHYAKEWLAVKPEARPQWGMLLDMVGDRDLKIRAGVRIPRASIEQLTAAAEGGYPIEIGAVERSITELSRDLLNAAEDLGYDSQVGISPDLFIGDHVPLNISAGIPTINLIDLDFPYQYTPGDTLDKISADSLEISGRVTLRLIEKYLLGNDS
ncbi:MAG: M28 family peptidase [Verrucomicrobiota bacterium]